MRQQGGRYRRRISLNHDWQGGLLSNAILTEMSRRRLDGVNDTYWSRENSGLQSVTHVANVKCTAVHGRCRAQ